MKNIFNLFIAVLCCCALFSCDNDEWSDGDPALEHVYYFHFENWGSDKSNYNNNGVKYDVLLGQSVEIPMQFQSERVRKYDITVYYYVSAGDLVRGTDYVITDDKGTTIEPDANGAFSMSFPQAKKGVKNVYVKSLSNGKKGSFDVMTFNPGEGAPKYPEAVINSQTNDYEVRVITTNYKVKVNVK